MSDGHISYSDVNKCARFEIKQIYLYFLYFIICLQKFKWSNDFWEFQHRIGLSHKPMLPLDGGAVTCPSIHASDPILIMVGDLADSATLGGAVALLTSGTRATSGSRLRKKQQQTIWRHTNNDGVWGVWQEEFDNSSVHFVHFLLSYLLTRLIPFPGEIPARNSRACTGRDLPVIQSDRVHMQVDSRLGSAQAQLSYRLR